MLINSPVFVALVWYVRKLSDINERLARLEGVLDGFFNVERKVKK